jgi:hypothetical protein
MASLYLQRSSEAVTVRISNPEPITPVQTMEHVTLLQQDDELTDEEVEDYYR